MNTEAENKTNKYLKGIVANLPEKPGIYQYLNAEGTIIYAVSYTHLTLPTIA